MHMVGEHYHVYNRGAHKAPIFHDIYDYVRFQSLLYTANNTEPLRNRWDQRKIWVHQNKEKLVEIFAYCLMPNHYHIGMIEKYPSGVERFMRRVCTSYVMYYNRKYMHSGSIFQGNPKSKLIDKDNYLRYLIDYIHLNPYGIEEPALSAKSKSEYRQKAIEYSQDYEFSSYKDYLGIIRPENLILRA